MHRIVALPGEGIGPEVLEAGLRVLRRLCALEDLKIEVEYGLIGDRAMSETGQPLPDETVRACRDADAILFGAVTKHGILELRREFDFYVNLRPVRIWPQFVECSALRPEIIEEVDILFVRELTSGIYFGQAGRDTDERGSYGYHTMQYHDEEIRRVARQALAWAGRRGCRLTVAHKENALPQIPWRELVQEESQAFPDVEVEAALVDSLAMDLVRRPQQFDVVLAGNLFGDILSDLGGALTGSLGTLPSASLNEDGFGLFEPVHGTAPDIAGQGIANPMGMFGSIEMMLTHWGYQSAARRLQLAQEVVIADGMLPPDLSRDASNSGFTTDAMAEAVADALEESSETQEIQHADL